MTWRVSEPANATEVPTGAGYIRENWAAIEAVLTSSRLSAGTEIPDYIPSGTKMWFYADSAPTGWTLDATPSDELLAIKGGSTYTTGGTSAGTWTQPDHTLTVSEIPDHTHATNATTSANSGSGPTIYAYSSSNPDTGATLSNGSTNSAHNHGSSWRPKARVGVVASKD